MRSGPGGRAARADLAKQHKAATHVQSAVRGQQARRRGARERSVRD
jgi:hypothetical protein